MLKMNAVDKVPPIRRRRNRGELMAFVDEFADMGCDTVEVLFVTPNDYKNARTCRGSLDASVKRSGHDFKVFERSGRVFMTKK